MTKFEKKTGHLFYVIHKKANKQKTVNLMKCETTARAHDVSTYAGMKCVVSL